MDVRRPWNRYKAADCMSEHYKWKTSKQSLSIVHSKQSFCAIVRVPCNHGVRPPINRIYRNLSHFVLVYGSYDHHVLHPDTILREFPMVR
jgi:hypothetical protein